jgi:hypothetical protein
VRFASFQILDRIVFLLIEPGTVSASVVVGTRLPLTGATIVIVGTLALTILILVVIKYLHDRLQHRNAAMTDRYIDLGPHIGPADRRYRHRHARDRRTKRRFCDGRVTSNEQNTQIK